MALATQVIAPTAAQIEDYVEQVVLLVRQSEAVQEARVDGFLDGATLAAEQVQDVRLQLLETPAQVEGWKFWVEVGIVFVLESNVVGKLLAVGGRKLFTPLVKSNALFLALPKSATGKELVALSKSLPRSDVVLSATRKSVLSGGFFNVPGTASKDSLQLYHSSIQGLIRLGSNAGIAADDIINAAVKGGAKARELTTPNDPLPITDSAGVVVLAAAQDYARATRLAIQIRHARIESFVRREASVPDLAVVVNTLGWEPLDVPQAGSEVALSLVDLRNKYRLVLEAMIWARLYGFSAGNPAISTNPDKPFPEIRKELQDYWRRRFQDLADIYARTVLGEKVLPGLVADALRLRKYFAAISTELQKVGLEKGELGALVPRRGG